MNVGCSKFFHLFRETNDSAKGIYEKNKSWSMKSPIGCNIFHGIWVKDDSYPLYKQGFGTITSESFDCHGNGRPDFEYKRLQWQPFGCNILR